MKLTLKELREIRLDQLIEVGALFARGGDQESINSVISVFNERIAALSPSDKEYRSCFRSLKWCTTHESLAVQEYGATLIYDMFRATYVYDSNAHQKLIQLLQKNLVYDEGRSIGVKLWATMALLEFAEMYWNSMASRIEAGEKLTRFRTIDLKEDVLVGTLEAAVEQELIYGYPQQYFDSIQESIAHSQQRIAYYMQENSA